MSITIWIICHKLAAQVILHITERYIRYRKQIQKKKLEFQKCCSDDSIKKTDQSERHNPIKRVIFPHPHTKLICLIDFLHILEAVVSQGVHLAQGSSSLMGWLWLLSRTERVVVVKRES